MTIAIQRKLANWIRHRVEMLPSATRFELEHVPEMSEDPSILLKVDARGETHESHERSRELAEQFFELADEHSHAFTGRQRYKLRAFDFEAVEIGCYVFALGFTGAGSSAYSEPGEPNERGLLAQLMRHNQQLATINVEQSQAVNSALIAENRDLRGRVEKVEAQRQEWFELLEGLHSQRHQREIEMVQEGARAETRNRALKLLSQYVPEALKKLGNGSAPAQLTAPEPTPLEKAFSQMRRVWRVVDRPWLLSHLDDENKERVHALMGAGAPIESIERFGHELKTLWASLPEDISDELQTQILTRDPSLAGELLELLDGQKEAAE
jgi:hypothetical protein